MGMSIYEGHNNAGAVWGSRERDGTYIREMGLYLRESSSGSYLSRGKEGPWHEALVLVRSWSIEAESRRNGSSFNARWCMEYSPSLDISYSLATINKSSALKGSTSFPILSTFFYFKKPIPLSLKSATFQCKFKPLLTM